MINLKTITLVVALSAGAGAASAEPLRETISVEFRYHKSDLATVSYAGFLRQARRACQTAGLRPLAQFTRERACAEELMDKLIDAMGRADIASVHAARTGCGLAASRDLAAR